MVVSFQELKNQKKNIQEKINIKIRVGSNPSSNFKLKTMVVFLILLGLAFYYVYKDDEQFKEDNMSDEGWNEKYNR
jgi:hypothetical protein